MRESYKEILKELPSLESRVLLDLRLTMLYYTMLYIHNISCQVEGLLVF